MKRYKKIILIIVGILVLISVFAYIDFFNTKANNTSPKMSIKEEIDENTIVYKALFYKVWYCKSNKVYTIGDYSDRDVICPRDYSYDNGYYTNEQGIKISKRDLQLLTNDGVYTSEMIENMNSNSQIEDAIHVAYNYGLNNYKQLSSKEKSSDGNKIVMLPVFKEVEGNFKWVYDEEDTNNYYCMKEKDDSIYYAKYDNKKCGKFEEVVMDEKWCSNYRNSTLISVEGIEKYCKSEK